ncbi:Methyltransferase type 11 (plasmid) [Solidesulfovibrio carbinoliphilus subsp. oakridgensis]|uniref:Methyltransferase type 11 n=1 Tax=Solidesulfovibrio carbinoliphilus subsp. oakridgensis TaxID=694327 RepID=G7QE64_9BACT|nr:class I SAM-dependent methyltransferase [Solidesulfovibrio carbinoliphilus]EHJ45958.1 Methyltransferase type 11 [Solidesulfovibrio carbinoliphilus subsp. oakridgensis]
MTEKSKEFPWTGERIVTSCALDHGGVIEHLHRYAFARDLAAGKAVLDIACGEGYGSNLLAQRAASVVGVDIAPDVVAHATEKYQRPNLEFRHGSCLDIPMPDASVDLLVSLETLEHFVEHEVFLREIKRVLRPQGLLVLSSPNRPEFSERHNISYPHHVRELDRQEFDDLITPHFRNIRMVCQRLLFGSCLFPETEATARVGVYSGTFTEVAFTPGLPRVNMFIALCSDGEIPSFPVSLYEGENTAQDQLGVVQNELNRVNAEREKLRRREAAMTAALEKKVAENARLALEIKRLATRPS